MQRFTVFAGFALAVLVIPAHATHLANAQNEDGTRVILTDESYPDCSRLGYTALAYIIKPDGSEQPACYGADGSIVTFLPLVERSNSQRTWGALGQALIGNQRGVNRASSYYDYGEKFSVPADAFAWATSESQGWIKATPP